MANKHQLSVNRWHYRLIRFIIMGLVRLFYPTIEVQNKENLPINQPTIFVLNHPNGLLDPMVLMVALNQPVSFLAKSTLFGYPVISTLVNAFGALPIFRKQDEGLKGGAKGDAADRNEETFARSRALLTNRGKLALFPEGTTHSKSELLPLRTGAARITLSAEAGSGWQLGVQVVPVGLWYQQKTQFRSKVLLVVGEPFTLAQYQADYEQDERKTVQAVTQIINQGLDTVVLQAENNYVLAALPVVARWTNPGGHRADLLEHHRWTTQLLATYRRLQEEDPGQLASIAAQAQLYADTLQTLGIGDPWVLEYPLAKQWKIVRLVAILVALFPFALAGWLLSYGPYSLAKPVAERLVKRDRTQIGTFKLIIGSLFVFLGVLSVAIIVGLLFGPWWGFLLFVSAIPLTYTALRWGEGFARLQEVVAGDWLRLNHTRLSESLKEERLALAEQILAAVESTSSQ